MIYKLKMVSLLLSPWTRSQGKDLCTYCRSHLGSLGWHKLLSGAHGKASEGTERGESADGIVSRAVAISLPCAMPSTVI